MTRPVVPSARVSGFSVFRDQQDPVPEFDLDAINHRHIHAIDKFYRMFAGTASRLLSFEDGVIEIEVRVDSRLKKFTPAEMAVKLAHSWHREPELSNATGFVAHVYKSGRPSGFVMPAGGRGREEVLEELVEHFRRMAEEHPDVLVKTVRGEFDRETPN